MKHVLLSLFLLFSLSFLAQRQRIGIFRNVHMKSLLFAYGNGTYNVFSDTVNYGAILPNEYFDVRYLNDSSLVILRGVDILDTVKEVFFQANNPSFYLSMTPRLPAGKERKYKENFNVYPRNGSITTVNSVGMNNYLSGVVESEGGASKEMEYLKVQATISRTYAMKNQSRHVNDGFSLCDQTHCQAYFHMLRFNQKIDTAVRLTDGLYLLDDHGHPIDAFFHANCGGQTAETDQVWNEKVERFQSFRDTFCIYTKQANWEKKILKTDWRDLLVNNYNYPENDSIWGPMLYAFNQPQRMNFFQAPGFGIPLRDIRDHFKLKSTFFNVYPDGQNVLLRGRGFGHGIGLCQEGAMRMARYGYSFEQIAHFYYPNITLDEINLDLFYRQVVWDGFGF